LPGKPCFPQLYVGELGSPGDYARIGGKGGEGEGPHLEMDPDERYRIGNISGE
jgi:hypothetical protein